MLVLKELIDPESGHKSQYIHIKRSAKCADYYIKNIILKRITESVEAVTYAVQLDHHNNQYYYFKIYLGNWVFKQCHHSCRGYF